MVIRVEVKKNNNKKNLQTTGTRVNVSSNSPGANTELTLAITFLVQTPELTLASTFLVQTPEPTRAGFDSQRNNMVGAC